MKFSLSSVFAIVVSAPLLASCVSNNVLSDATSNVKYNAIPNKLDILTDTQEGPLGMAMLPNQLLIGQQQLMASGAANELNALAMSDHKKKLPLTLSGLAKIKQEIDSLITPKDDFDIFGRFTEDWDFYGLKELQLAAKAGKKITGDCDNSAIEIMAEIFKTYGPDGVYLLSLELPKNPDLKSNFHLVVGVELKDTMYILDNRYNEPYAIYDAEDGTNLIGIIPAKNLGSYYNPLTRDGINGLPLNNLGSSGIEYAEIIAKKTHFNLPKLRLTTLQ